MIFWFLACILLVGLIILLALVLPVILTASVAGGTSAKVTGSGSIRLYGGLLGIGVTADKTSTVLSVLIGRARIGHISFQSAIDRPRKRKKPKKVKEKPVPGTEKPLSEKLRGGWQQFKEIAPRLKKGYRDFWYIVSIERFASHVGFGLENPARMGKLIGAIALLNTLLPKPFSITQSFDFTRRFAEGTLDCRIRIRLDRFWRVLFTYIPDILRLVRSRRKKPAEAQVIAQEVA